MILILNQKQNLDFIMNVFTSSNSFLDIIFSIGNSLPYSSETRVVKGIINNLFMQEYKGIFFRTPQSTPLENIFIQEQLKVSDKMQKGITVFSKDSYNSILDLLINFGISYDNYDTEKYGKDTLFFLKTNIVRSIIRIVFSKEKYYYMNNDSDEIKPIKFIMDENEEFYKFYEFNFINGLIYKYMIDIKQKYGDDYEKLFRKNTLFEDIITEIFFYFGHDCIIKAFIEPFKRLVSNVNSMNTVDIQSILNPNKKQEKKESKPVKTNTKGMNIYEIFISEVLTNLKTNLPFVLKVVLKLIIKIYQELFTLESQNYTPIFNLLFFSFLFSERAQKAFYLHKSGNSNLLILIEKIIRNTIYNTSFPLSEQLSLYNTMISNYHGKLNSFVRECILNVKEDSLDTKTIIRNIALSNYLEIPKFIFCIDCENVVKVAPGGFSDIIEYEEIK